MVCCYGSRIRFNSIRPCSEGANFARNVTRVYVRYLWTRCIGALYLANVRPHKHRAYTRETIRAKFAPSEQGLRLIKILSICIENIHLQLKTVQDTVW